MISLYATEPGSIVHLEGDRFQVSLPDKLCCEIAVDRVAIVESLLRAKLHNSRLLLLHLNSSQHLRIVERAINSLANLLEELPSATTRKGFWKFGAASVKIYFQALSYLLPESFNFKGRSANLAGDRINNLLELGYALLSQNLYACVQKFGLHPDFGNLHHTCENHTPLVCDLMEQFRAPIVESLVVDLVNRKHLTAGDFFPAGDRGGWHLNPGALREFLLHWESKLQSPTTHLNAGKISYRQCLELQVKEYLACVQGERDFYRSLLWKEEV